MKTKKEKVLKESLIESSDQVNILVPPPPPHLGGGEAVNLVLSWNFLANQNRAFYMQRLANLIYFKRWVEDLNLVYLGWLGGGGEAVVGWGLWEDVNLIRILQLRRLVLVFECHFCDTDSFIHEYV